MKKYELEYLNTMPMYWQLGGLLNVAVEPTLMNDHCSLYTDTFLLYLYFVLSYIGLKWSAPIVVV